MTKSLNIGWSQDVWFSARPRSFRMRSSFKTIACAGIILTTAGCAQLNLGGQAFTADGDIAAAKRGQASVPFNEELRVGYLALAQKERDIGDWRDAGFFGAKAASAAADRTPAISPLSRWELPANHVPEFQQGLVALNTEFDSGARERAPAAAAKAQTMFECWAEEQEENWQTNEIAACRQQFQLALKQIQDELAPLATSTMQTPPAATPAPQAVAEPPARDYLVFFDFDQSAIRPDSAGILNRVVDAMRDLKARAVELVGHTDRAGASDYNQRLSERRAAAVRSYLAGRGIPVEDMTTSGRGETDPRVETPDGVREQENRRVEINLQ